MTSEDWRRFFELYRGSVAYIEVETPIGDRSIGAAFHVGNGVFVTARHVVDGNVILSMATTEDAYLSTQGADRTEGEVGRAHRGDEVFDVVIPGPLTVRSGPHFHPDSLVDVAVIETEGLNPLVPAVDLGGHLDDWIGKSDFVLSEVVVLGYPPIPFDREATLVALRAEVIAQIDPYDRPHVHFVLSVMPRGGQLSGGIAWSEWGFVLGLITHSAARDGKAEELGYLCVVTVEPIYECLAAHNLLPSAQTKDLDGVFDT